MNDQFDRKVADFPEELPDMLGPEIEADAEEPEAALPVPSDLDLVQRYIREANRFALLTPEEEKALTAHYHETGDRETGSRLITSNLRLVIKIALEFQKYWMKNLLDLIQEGNIGLMHAIRKFDPYRGIKLS